jgi:hypothetical protein
MIRSSEKRIATIAPRAICRPKLAETVWIWLEISWPLPKRFVMRFERLLVSSELSDFSRSWKFR